MEKSIVGAMFMGDVAWPCKNIEPGSPGVVRPAARKRKSAAKRLDGIEERAAFLRSLALKFSKDRK